MSLRVRLVLLIVALVALVAIALSAVHLANLVNLLSADALDRSKTAADQVGAFVMDHIAQHSLGRPAPPDLNGIKTEWTEIVSTDPDIPTMLVNMLKLSQAIKDIDIAGPNGNILVSSDPPAVGRPLQFLPSFEQWNSGSLFTRLLDLLTRRADYQFVIPLGVKGEAEPLFRIQVVVSSVLLRAALLAQIATLAYVSAVALLLSVLITWFATNRVLRPLRRIEATIDRIVQGNFRGGEPAGRRLLNPPAEFAAVEGKLNLLGERFIGAREQAVELQHDLDGLLERMATELDVATRLAAISRITGGVAHEIKNPLNAISLRLDLLRARLCEPRFELGDELAGEIDILSKEVRRLDRVVKTFLDFSRPVDVKLTEVNLAAIAKEVADLTKPQARLSNIRVWFEEAKSSAEIRGDADMLKQAILNLVLNAMEAMKGGGNLWLRVSRDANVVVLNVSDDGPGIPPEVKDKVFQLYFTTKQRGSGIGLAMTYRAVQLHNGTIDFSTELGRGTAFQMQFPALVRYA